MFSVLTEVIQRKDFSRVTVEMMLTSLKSSEGITHRGVGILFVQEVMGIYVNSRLLFTPA